MAQVTLTISDELLAQIDRLAAYGQYSRSELIQEALRRYLLLQQPNRTIQSAHSTAQEAAGIVERLRTKAACRAQNETDSAEVIRAFRGELRP